MITRHLCALVRWQLVRRSETEPAPMHVKHHRPLPRQTRRPYVQLQHVLALPPVVPVKEERLLDSRPCMQVLWAVCSVHQGWILVRPRRGRLGREPAILSGRRCAIRNTFERQDTAIQKSAYLAILRLRDRRARRRDVAGLLVSRGLDAVRCECRLARDDAHSGGGRNKERLAASEHAPRKFRHKYLSFATRAMHIARRRESDRSQRALLCRADHRRC